MQVATEQLDARAVWVDVPDRVPQPLARQDERCLVPGPGREADNPLQRQDPEAEVDDGLPDRLARGV